MCRAIWTNCAVGLLIGAILAAAAGFVGPALAGLVKDQWNSAARWSRLDDAEVVAEPPCPP
jgi:hypothetical protein